MAHFRTTTTTTTTNSFSLLLPLSLLLILSLNTLIEAQLPPFIGNGRKANAREFLTHHNKVRIGMQEPPLVWDRTIAKYARRYAEHRRGDCQLIHSMGPYGENIFWGGGLDWRPVDAVRSWIDEHQFYNKTANACAPSKLCGHYTQVVWRETTRLGCARVECNTTAVFINCNYYPPGNYLGESPFGRSHV